MLPPSQNSSCHRSLLQCPGMSEEAISTRPPFPPAIFQDCGHQLHSPDYRAVGGGTPHPLPNPLNGTVNPRYLDVATRPQDDSGGECMNSGKTALLGSYCPLKHVGLCWKDAETEGHRWGSQCLWGSSGSPSRAVDTWVQWIPLEPRGSLTLDFSCPRPGGTNPARSRDRRQDARRIRAMAGWGASWGGHRPSEVSEALSHISSPPLWPIRSQAGGFLANGNAVRI